MGLEGGGREVYAACWNCVFRDGLGRTAEARVGAWGGLLMVHVACFATLVWLLLFIPFTNAFHWYSSFSSFFFNVMFSFCSFTFFLSILESQSSNHASSFLRVLVDC